MLLMLLIAAIQLDGPARQGEAVGVSVSRDGAPLAGQPLLEIAPAGGVDRARRAAGTTDARGLVAWTPSRSGLVLLEIGGEQRVVAVAPASRAPAAVVLLTLALGLALPAWRLRARIHP